MKGRPPKKLLTPEQERAASAFVEAADRSTPAPDPPTSTASSPTASSRRVAGQRREPDDERPWEADYVREDVTKGYALRLPEPLYLKLKWVADQTGRSINTVCRDAVEAEVEAFLRGT